MATGLIIHEDKSLLDSLCALLTLKCDRVFRASTGKEGIALACDVQPDIILTDFRLPDMNGNTLVFTLRQNPDLPHIPVILIGSFVPVEARMHSLTLFDSVLPMPFKVPDLLDRIDQQLHKAHVETLAAG